VAALLADGGHVLLRHVGWRAYQVETYVNWCGHGQEVIPWPQADGSCQFIPVLGSVR
jgi:hypothetical protein